MNQVHMTGDQSEENIPHTTRALPISLLRARETVMIPIREFLNESGLTEQKWRILRSLDELGQIEQSQIASETCISLPSLTRTLRAMEADGQITRTNDANDRRRTLVAITDQGKDLLVQNLPASNALYQKIEKAYGRKKLEQLLDLLEDLQDIKL